MTSDILALATAAGVVTLSPAEQARDDLDRTLRAWHHGFASAASLHAATTTWIEAEG